MESGEELNMGILVMTAVKYSQFLLSGRSSVVIFCNIICSLTNMHSLNGDIIGHGTVMFVLMWSLQTYRISCLFNLEKTIFLALTLKKNKDSVVKQAREKFQSR